MWEARRPPYSSPSMIPAEKVLFGNGTVVRSAGFAFSTRSESSNGVRSFSILTKAPIVVNEDIHWIHWTKKKTWYVQGISTSSDSRGMLKPSIRGNQVIQQPSSESPKRCLSLHKLASLMTFLGESRTAILSELRNALRGISQEAWLALRLDPWSGISSILHTPRPGGQPRQKRGVPNSHFAT